MITTTSIIQTVVVTHHRQRCICEQGWRDYLSSPDREILDLDIYNDEGQTNKPFWFCEECRYLDYKKKMPVDRQAFYSKVSQYGGPKCPKCKSQSFMPKGY